ASDRAGRGQGQRRAGGRPRPAAGRAVGSARAGREAPFRSVDTLVGAAILLRAVREDGVRKSLNLDQGALQARLVSDTIRFLGGLRRESEAFFRRQVADPPAPVFENSAASVYVEGRSRRRFGDRSICLR